MNEETFRFMVCSEPEETQKEIRRIMEENESAGHYDYALTTLWGLYFVSYGQFKASPGIGPATYNQLKSENKLVLNEIYY